MYYYMPVVFEVHMERCRRRVAIFIIGVLLAIISAHYINDSVQKESSSTTTKAKTKATISSKAIEHDVNNFPNPLKPIIELAQGEKFHLTRPIFGQHNPSSDAVLVFANGYQPPAILRFVESLINTGYDGDIVLGLDYERLIKSLQEKGEAFKQYIQHRSKFFGLVVYNVELQCAPNNPTLCTAPNMYQTNSNSTTFFPDRRIARSVKLLRYEYYWAWATNYVNSDAAETAGRIFVSDLRDVYFQKNPFTAQYFSSQELLSISASSDRQQRQQRTLQVFVEDTSRFEIISQTSNARWIRTTKGEKILEEIGHNPIVCSGTTMGGAIAIESYLRAIIEEFDTTQCDLDGCDQGLHNYLLTHNDCYSPAMETTKKALHLYQQRVS